MVRPVVELDPMVLPKQARVSDQTSGGVTRQRPNRSDRRPSAYSKTPSPTHHLSPLRHPTIGLSCAISTVSLATTPKHWRRFPPRCSHATASIATAGCITKLLDQKGRLEHARDVGRMQADMSWSTGHRSVDEWREAAVVDFLRRPSTATQVLASSSSLHAMPRRAIIRPATSQQEQRTSCEPATRQLPQLPEAVSYPELPSSANAENMILYRPPRHAPKATRRDQPPRLEPLSPTKGNLQSPMLEPPDLSIARKHVLRGVRLKPEYAWLASDE